jgi:hypothetical protein
VPLVRPSARSSFYLVKTPEELIGPELRIPAKIRKRAAVPPHWSARNPHVGLAAVKRSERRVVLLIGGILVVAGCVLAAVAWSATRK